MKTALFVHNNFPGQLGHLAAPLQLQGWRCHAIANDRARGAPGVDLHRYTLRRGTTPGVLDLAVRAEADMIRGWHVAEVARGLKANGLKPDVIIGHTGWGETLFLKEVFPEARLIAYAEYYYDAVGGDCDFDPEFGLPDLAGAIRLHAKSATLALAYAHADVLVAPTPFQASRLPERLGRDVRVLFEGVDCEAVRPRTQPVFRLAGGRVLDRTRPVVTFVSRALEPLRGIHTFLRALPAFLNACSEADVLVIGDAQASGYGLAPPPGGWANHFVEQTPGLKGHPRLHFTGPLGRADYLDALAVSAAHVYLTYPFTLSWSLVEAMACGCLVIASDTAPVRDAITPGQDGVLVDFFDVAALSDTLASACRHPDDYAPLREQARATALRRFDRDRICTPRWLTLIEEAAVSDRRAPDTQPTANS